MEPIIDVNKMAFKEMTKLKTLVIENGHLSKGLKYLPRSLSVLKWKGFTSKSLSSWFSNKVSEIISFCNCVHLYIQYKSIVSHFYLFVSYMFICGVSSTT